MITLPGGNRIPSTFKLANHDFKVVLVDKIKGGTKYGIFNDAKCEIVLAKVLDVDNEDIEINDEQIMNTFWHELMHVFQYFYNNGTDEAQAQVYANFMREFLSSTNLPF